MIFRQTCAARAAPAPGLPRAGAGRPRDARIEKKSQVHNFWRILKGGPCNLQADHRQIMGRSWAVSRIFPQLYPNCTKSLYNHQRRSGAQKRRGTFAYMATPYCDFKHFQCSFSAEAMQKMRRKCPKNLRVSLFSAKGKGGNQKWVRRSKVHLHSKNKSKT